MKYPLIRLALVGFILALGCILMTACSSMEPYEYHDEAEEGMSGPGLITGEEGEKTIFSIPADPKDQPEDAQAEDTPKEAPESERMIQP